MQSGGEVHELIDKADMLPILQKLTKARQHLRLTLPESTQDYSTIILDCDLLHRELVLDQAIRDEGHLDWHQHQKITLDGTVAGVHYLLQNLSVLADSEGIGQRVKFPKKIVYQQRRLAFRSAIPRAIRSHLKIQLDAKNYHIDGRILDLSATGLACECDDETELNKENLKELKNIPVSLSIELSDLLTVVCIGEIKEVLPSKAKHKIRLGLAFNEVGPSVQRKIDKAVADLQRITRKNETR